MEAITELSYALDTFYFLVAGALVNIEEQAIESLAGLRPAADDPVERLARLAFGQHLYREPRLVQLPLQVQGILPVGEIAKLHNPGAIN